MREHPYLYPNKVCYVNTHGALFSQNIIACVGSPHKWSYNWWSMSSTVSKIVIDSRQDIQMTEHRIVLMSHFSCLKLISSQYPGVSLLSPCFTLHPAGIYCCPKNRCQEMSLTHTGTRCILFFFFRQSCFLFLSSFCNQSSITKACRTLTQGRLCVWF